MGVRNGFRAARGLSAASIVLAAAAAARSAAGTTTAWATPASGPWSSATNWTAGVPVSGVDAAFATGASTPYAVTVDANGQANSIAVTDDSLTLAFGNGGLNVGSPYGLTGLSGQVNVTADAGRSASLTLAPAAGATTHGTLYFSGKATFGGSAGPVAVTVDGLDVYNSSNAARGITVGTNSTVAFRNGSTFHMLQGSGLTVNGAATIDASALASDNGSETLFLTGVGTVPATLSVSNGSSALLSATIVGPTPPGASVVVDRSTFGGGSTLGVGVGLLFGFTPPAGFYIASVGTGSITARDGSTVRGGQTFVGGSTDGTSVGTGAIDLADPGTSLIAGTLNVATTGGVGRVSIANGATATTTVVNVGGGNASRAILVLTGPAATLVVGSAPYSPGTLSVGAGGTLSIGPGDSAAVVGTNGAGAYNQSAGATLAVQLADVANPYLSTGTATLGGTLAVTLAARFTPASNETFPILSFASESGRFAAVSLPPLPAPLAWDTSRLYTAGVLATVPEPATVAGVVVVVGTAALTRRRRRRR